MLTARKTRSPAAAALLAALAAAATPRRRRSLRAFAEAEFVHPSGVSAGRRFRIAHQPLTGLWLDQVDSGRWTYIYTTGPSQSGKTVLGSELPVLYHLFELGEVVIFGVPDMAMAADKWALDLKPAIGAGRYRELLPVRGDGARDGKHVDLVRFGNGAALKFMGGGGGDKQRAHFTARVLVVTETDGFDVTTGESPEADKFEQLLARLRAYREEVRRLYAECTLTTKTARTFREIAAGTASRIACPCTHCGAWVSPDREHLVGWQGAENVVAARTQAAYLCPACGVLLSETDRQAMNAAAVLVHNGQTVSGPAAAPVIAGDPPPTLTLGFRWNAFNNLLLRAADVAADEFGAKRDPDETNAERKLRQFVWALPYVPEEVEGADLSWDQVANRVTDLPRGIVPAEASHLSAFLDLGKRLCHWAAVAFLPDGSPHVVDYGALETAWDAIGDERALLTAMRDWRELCSRGWAQSCGVGVQLKNSRKPDVGLVDSGDWTERAYEFVREAASKACGFALFAAKGFGQSTTGRGYSRPRQRDARVRAIGDDYHVARVSDGAVSLVEHDADAWKSWVRARCMTPRGQPGALTLFAGTAKEHLAFSKHLVAEQARQEFDVRLGRVKTKWSNSAGRPNHWLDAVAGCGVAGHLAGVRLAASPAHPAPPASPKPPTAPTVTREKQPHRARGGLRRAY